MTEDTRSVAASIPKRLLGRPRDVRGYPIPYIQFVDPVTGEPNFRVNDVEKVLHALKRRLCGLCGQEMGVHIHFIGGPKCVRFGYFLDPAMHRECAEFALRTCPHLARIKGKYNESAVPDYEGYALVDSNFVDHSKSEIFALMHAKRYTFGKPNSRDPLIIKAELPWQDVTWWQGGEVVAEADVPESIRSPSDR